MQTEGCHLVNGKIYGFHSKKASALKRRKCVCGMDPILNWVSNVSYANCCQIEYTYMALRPTTLYLCKKQKGAVFILSDSRTPYSIGVNYVCRAYGLFTLDKILVFCAFSDMFLSIFRSRIFPTNFNFWKQNLVHVRNSVPFS